MYPPDEELARLENCGTVILQAKSYMLISMSNEMKRRFEEALNTTDIYMHLQELYGAQTHPLKHAAVKKLMTTHLQDSISMV